MMGGRETDPFVKRIQNDYDSIYNRRREINGVGIIYAEGKCASLLQEAVYSYILGHYFSTIAVSGMAAERICYDY